MITLTPDEARRYLVSHAGLARSTLPTGAEGVRALLAQLRCIQLDPLDPIGNNADLVALARVDGIQTGDVHAHLLPGHAFEHFAKERCLLPATAFPYYRDQAAETPWWRLGERLAKLDASILDAVLAEVKARGPLSSRDLSDHGSVEPMDWAGWKGTSRAAAMALEVLWTRCQVVVCGLRGRAKLFDVPSRALGRFARRRAKGDFSTWALVERVEAAGLLRLSSGPQWSMLSSVRTSALPGELVRQGILEEVRITGGPRVNLAPAGFRERPILEPDDRARLLGPLDPLIWDRTLVSQLFGFDYVWEVYKPKEKRLWGWYVCPVLHRGKLVGRFEAHRGGDGIVVDHLWKERGRGFEKKAFDRAIARLAAAQARSSI